MTLLPRANSWPSDCSRSPLRWRIKWPTFSVGEPRLEKGDGSAAKSKTQLNLMGSKMRTARLEDSGWWSLCSVEWGGTQTNCEPFLSTWLSALFLIQWDQYKLWPEGNNTNIAEDENSLWYFTYQHLHNESPAIFFLFCYANNQMFSIFFLCRWNKIVLYVNIFLHLRLRERGFRQNRLIIVCCVF